MKPLSSTQYEHLNFRPRTRDLANLRFERFPLRNEPSMIGLEAYYLADTLREIADIFRCPAHIMVCHIDGTHRCVRVQLPNPTGPHLAAWFQRACSIFGWDKFASTIAPSEQVYFLGRVVDPAAWEPIEGLQDEVAFSSDPSARLAQLGIDNGNAGQCSHGVSLRATCETCYDDMPY